MEHALSDDYEIILEHGRERYRAICTCGRLGRAKSDRADAATGIKIHAAAANKRERRANAYRMGLTPGPHIEEHW